MSRFYYSNASGKVSVALDGCLRAVCNPDVFLRLFNGHIDPNKMLRYDGAAPIAEGQSLSLHAKLVKTDTDPAVYLIDDENSVQVKRWVVSADMFNALDFDWSKIETISQAKSNEFALGRPLSFEKPDLYAEWRKQMQSLGESQHPGTKVSIDFRDKGATVDAVCWYGDGFNTPSGGNVIGTWTKPEAYSDWQRKMQSLGESQHPGTKVSIDYRDQGATIDAVCWYGDGFNTPAGGNVIGTWTKA